MWWFQCINWFKFHLSDFLLESSSKSSGPGTGIGSARRDLIDSAKQSLDKPLLLYFSEGDTADARSDTRSDTRSETGSEGALEEFTREMEETADEVYERESTRLRLQRGRTLIEISAWSKIRHTWI